MSADGSFQRIVDEVVQTIHKRTEPTKGFEGYDSDKVVELLEAAIQLIHAEDDIREECLGHTKPGRWGKAVNDADFARSVLYGSDRDCYRDW